MKRAHRCGAIAFAVMSTAAVAFYVAQSAAWADYFDPDSDTVSTVAGTEQEGGCKSGHEGYGGDCEYGTLTLTIKHNGAYWTDWILSANSYSSGVHTSWFESGSDDAPYAFGFTGNPGTKSVTFNVHTTGGSESLNVDLRHDDDDDDAWDGTDELFDYFALTLQ